MLLVAATTSLVLLAFLVPLGLLLRTLAEDRAIAQAVQEVQGLAVVAAVVVDPAQLEPVVQLADQSSVRDVSVVLPSRRVLGAPVDAGSRSLALAFEGSSFTATTAGGREVLVPVVQATDQRVVVRAFVPESELRRGVGPALGVLLGLATVLLAVALLVADRLARGTVRPVTALARATRALAAGDLQAQVQPDGPIEVREVGVAVNELGTRIGELLAAEREYAADLSHRLRTPLTALRLQVEGLRSPAERAALGSAVEALDAAVSAVIRTARNPRQGDREHCDAVEVVRERASFWQVLAEDQGRPWSVALPSGPRPVRLPAPDLSTALDVLLENAFTHTGDVAPIAIGVRDDGDLVAVEVVDAGPGLAPAALERGRSGAGSTGLGLDIARRTAEQAGGGLVVEDRPTGGARVVLLLGRHEPTSSQRSAQQSV